MPSISALERLDDRQGRSAPLHRQGGERPDARDCEGTRLHGGLHVLLGVIELLPPGPGDSLQPDQLREVEREAPLNDPARLLLDGGGTTQVHAELGKLARIPLARGRDVSVAIA
jgi:hypothetical protein